MYMALETAMSRRNEASVFIEEEQRQSVLRGLFTSYYGPLHKDKIIIDTNRAWCTKLPALGKLFPNAKVICCVRNISWIMDSIERLVRRNAFEPSGMFGFEAGGTVYTRINRIAASDGMVGYALDALREAFFGEDAHRLILVEYQALTRAPGATLAMLYDILGLPNYQHDFDNVEYQADDFDLALGARGLHTVRRKVEWIDRETILPPELFNRFSNDMFWRNSEAVRRNVTVLRYIDG
jgi:sulfotransferase